METHSRASNGKPDDTDLAEKRAKRSHISSNLSAYQPQANQAVSSPPVPPEPTPPQPQPDPAPSGPDLGAILDALSPYY